MSYKYDPCRNTFTYIDDESPITANIYMQSSTSSYQIVEQVELSDECIQKIADRIAEALEKVRAKGMENQKKRTKEPKKEPKMNEVEG